MKISCTVLSLFVFQTAGAFMAPVRTTGAQSATQLHSQPPYFGTLNREQTSDVYNRAPVNGMPSTMPMRDSNDSKMSTGSRDRGDRDRDTKPTKKSDLQFTKNMWDTLSPVTVQGGSLRTWSIDAERVQVFMKTDGRPLNANIELWNGPDNTPLKMGIYVEDGDSRPFSAVIETPRGHNAIAIRNTAQMEFPLGACVEADAGKDPARITTSSSGKVASKTIQGGAVHTYPFSSSVASVQVLLKTEGRPMSARIELLQGPNNIKQVIEIFTEDGFERPFYAVIQTPGSGNVVRIVNVATVEYPMTASVEPYFVEQGSDSVSEGSGNWDKSTSGFSLLKEW